MGLFGSERVTRVGTSVMRVLEDKYLPDSNKTGILKSIFEDGDSVPRYILNEYLQSIGIRAEHMYAYAAKGKYAYGLPSGETISSAAGADRVEEVLHTLETDPIELEYSQFGLPNYTHVAWMEIIRRYDWDSTTNRLNGLGIVDNAEALLVSFQILLPIGGIANTDPFRLEQWGDAPEAPITMSYTHDMQYIPPRDLFRTFRHMPIIESSSVAVPTVKMTYRRQITTGEFFLGLGDQDLYFDLPSFPEEQDYFQAEYTVNGKRKFWMYATGAGTYPRLDEVFDLQPGVSGDFFPFLYLRFGKRSMADDRASFGYTSSKKMFKYLGAKYDDLIEGVHENPDIGDIEQAMVIMAVPANTSDPLEARYLYDYFDRLRLRQDENPLYSRAMADAWEFFDNVMGSNPRYVQVIQDQRFKMTLGNSGIYKRRVGGSIGPKGTHTVAYTLVSRNKDWGPDGKPVTTQIRSHVLRKQITDTMYDEIHVDGLGMRYHIYGRYSELGDTTEEHLLVPVDRTVTQSYNIATKERLYSRSLHYVFNSRVTVKVKWYQSGFFSFLITAVALVIAVYTAGTSLAALGSAVAAGTISVTAAVMTALVGILKSLLVMVALQFAVKLVGPEVGMVIALLMMAYAAYTGFTTQGGIKNAPFAQDLLKLGTNLTNAVSEHYSKAMEGLQKEAQALQLEIDSVSEMIEEAQNLLHVDTYLTPMMIIGESPKQFYTRTIRAGNVGVHAVKSISTFVPRALALPTLADTLGGNFNHVA